MIELEYCRIIRIRFLLGVEEIVTELLTGEDPMLFAPSQPGRQKLLDMRVLVGIACRNMALFEERCQAHRVQLSFADIKRQCLRKSPTFKLLEPFIDKTIGLEELINFQECYDVGKENHHIVEDSESDGLGDEARSHSLEILTQDESTACSSVSS